MKIRYLFLLVNLGIVSYVAVNAMTGEDISEELPQAQESSPKITLTQQLVNFPKDGHFNPSLVTTDPLPSDIEASSFIAFEKWLSPINFDTTRVAITFNHEPEKIIKNIFALFSNHYGYPERKLVGKVLYGESLSKLNAGTTYEDTNDNSFPSKAQVYFWKNLIDPDKHSSVLERFVRLNALTIFYRDLNILISKFAADSNDKNTPEQKIKARPSRKGNGIFSNELIDCIGLLFETLNKSREELTKSNEIHLLDGFLFLGNGGINFENYFENPQTDMYEQIDNVIHFIITKAQAALDRANALFEKHGLPKI